MSPDRYGFPWRQLAEGEEVLDRHEGHVCFADSPEAARIIVNLANTAHAAAENSRRFLEEAEGSAGGRAS